MLVEPIGEHADLLQVVAEFVAVAGTRLDDEFEGRANFLAFLGKSCT